MVTYLDPVVLSSGPMTELVVDREVYRAWWNSPDVEEARRLVGYDQEEGGTLVDVLAAILEVVDRREVESHQTPKYPVSVSAKRAAEDFAKGAKVNHFFAGQAAMQMLDMGAEPERLRAVFEDHIVDRAVSRWRPWRHEVWQAARKGASEDEIRALAPGKNWTELVNFLKLHGFEYEKVDRRETSHELHRQIIVLHKQGLSNRQIAIATGCSRANIRQTIHRAVTGVRPDLQELLTA